mmetsp:Transcript_13465/g.23829  ORF Transcript_13465/g.23829 Transcript_13465/m.23829 type:complete len:250 (-) Transcript_13465:673-1422(-)
MLLHSPSPPRHDKPRDSLSLSFLPPLLRLVRRGSGGGGEGRQPRPESVGGEGFGLDGAVGFRIHFMLVPVEVDPHEESGEEGFRKESRIDRFGGGGEERGCCLGDGVHGCAFFRGGAGFGGSFRLFDFLGFCPSALLATVRLLLQALPLLLGVPVFGPGEINGLVDQIQVLTQPVDGAVGTHAARVEAMVVRHDAPPIDDVGQLGHVLRLDEGAPCGDRHERGDGQNQLCLPPLERPWLPRRRQRGFRT